EGRPVGRPFPEVHRNKSRNHGQAPLGQLLPEPPRILGQIARGPQLGPFVAGLGHLVQHLPVGQLRAPAGDFANAPRDGGRAHPHAHATSCSSPLSGKGTGLGSPVRSEARAASAISSERSPSSTPTAGSSPRRRQATKCCISARYASRNRSRKSATVSWLPWPFCSTTTGRLCKYPTWMTPSVPRISVRMS